MSTPHKSEQKNPGEPKIVSPDEAIALLKKGNERYVEMNRLPDPGVGPSARQPLTKGQWPYVSILSCSDSRVPPEVIFDEGLGRLFIIRVAGNMLYTPLLGSIEYASMHSTCRLIVVMGHESCGAVAATVKASENPGSKETPAIDDLIDHLLPAVKKAKEETGLSGDELVEAAAKENVRMTVDQIVADSDVLRKMKDSNEIKIIGAYYSLSTGKVDIWE